MSGDPDVMIGWQTRRLLELLAVERRQTVEQTLSELIEAEVERVEPGLLEELRRPSGAIKRFYAVMGKPVPPGLTATKRRRHAAAGEPKAGRIYGRARVESEPE